MKRGRNQRRRQGVNINRAFDSNGPDVRIRGTANQIYDKYLALARDASSAGDRVKAENYLQHAEHYFRVLRAMQPSAPAPVDQPEDDGDQPMIGEAAPRPREKDQRQPDPAIDAAGRRNEAEAAPAPEASNGAEGPSPQDGESEPRRRRRRPRRQSAASGSEDSEADGREEEVAAGAAS